MIGDPDRSRILASSLHSGTPPPFAGYRRNGLFNENEVVNSRNSSGTDAALEYAGLGTLTARNDSAGHKESTLV